MGLEGDEQEGYCVAEGENCDVDGYAVLALAVYRLTLKAHNRYRARMYETSYLRTYGFYHKYDSRNLQTACRRACTAADEDEAEDKSLGEFGPEVEIDRRKAAGGDDTRHLEEGVSNSI